MHRIIMSLLPMLALTSCFDDLDRFPVNDTTAEVVYSTFEGTKEALAKVYGAYSLSGQTGPAGNPDVVGLDEGSNADFLRCWFNHQEMPTDEAHCIWADPGIPELNNINFTSDGAFTIGLYSKCILIVMYANDFIRNTEGRNYGEQQTEVNYFRGEVRFLRAFAYWVLLDQFGRPPFVTEKDGLGIMPAQIERANLFEYIESELLDLVNNNELKTGRSNEYGRADISAVSALLARLYLNAEVYTGTARWTEAITYSKKVIESGYTLKNNYEHLFLADNDKNNPEVILPITYDGKSTRGYGGVTFLINCGSSSDYQTEYADKIIHYGIFTNANWNGYRFRKEFIDKFEEGDKRFLFVGENPALGDDPSKNTNGLQTYKYRNITSASTPGNPVYGSDQEFVDNDFPLFRLAEQYLIYAEAVVRGGSGGSMNEAIGYINQLRERAFGNTNKNVSSIDAQSLLDERARELYWECFRRTDLIRYDQFTTSNYVWEWKGGVKAGRAVSNHYNLYPIPSQDLLANPNLKQNANY
ncbi:RagB/SusD family nutrient uptake outer membrane protein [Proteiniphilum sp.]|uniref:RagB/SusD family nutrient uptake outer membrane protein n=1 Tax=Proteiniphilum sp. TaxID=1926877 RepID=UPI002B217A6F|nr:RagB/SusD family nutrient uptake outer membrane protein [Proteiniphilum sp.]MEA5128221.1 RagB/SusD family nutrient uptake outer membrane protein [Proteiniphilum sp.]